MNPRLISQVVLLGSQIIGRAFVEAYRNAAASAARNTAGGAAAASASRATQKTGLTLDEAGKILNVREDAAIEDVMKRHEHLFKANDPKAGGSFYLQSKVYRARERFELERGISGEGADKDGSGEGKDSPSRDDPNRL